MRTGLVSISFRKHTTAEVAKASAAAGLECIEWGGDIHVPHGDLTAAREAAAITQDAGLAVSSYGSYLRLGEPDQPDHRAVVDTALALGAPIIRVWAGKRASKDATDQYRAWVVEETLRLAEMVAAAGIKIAFEYHGNTLTDTRDSAKRFFEETAHPAAKTFWQPPQRMETEECVLSLEEALPYLANVHVFYWWPDAKHRRPLADGMDRWRRFVSQICSYGADPDLLLEFMPDDSITSLSTEAATLRRLVTE